MVTDQQVALLRQRQMEGKKQQTAAAMAAMAGMSERSARKWQCGPLPSETKTERRWRTRPDPFDGVWEEEILPLLQGRGRRQAQGNDNYRVAGGEIPRPVQRLPAPHPATPITGLASAQRAGSGGLLPPRASTWPGGAARLHPLQLSGSDHRRPALPPPAVPAGVEPFRVALRRGGCWRDLCGPEAGTAERALGTGRRAPDHTLRQQPRPSPMR